MTKRARRSTKRTSPTSIAPMALRCRSARLPAVLRGPLALLPVVRRTTTVVGVAVAGDGADRVAVAAAGSLA
jgi:hypothetical protein